MSYVKRRPGLEKWLYNRTNFTKTEIKNMSLKRLRWFWFNPHITRSN